MRISDGSSEVCSSDLTSPRPISDKSNASESQNRQARDRRSGPGARPGKFPDAREREEMRCPDEQTSQHQSPGPHQLAPIARPNKAPTAPCSAAYPLNNMARSLLLFFGCVTSPRAARTAQYQIGRASLQGSGGKYRWKQGDAV